jgi:hypothetical protein
MSLEDAFADLLAVAKHRGELDREAVRKATTVLTWPRYADSPDPGGLLVEDLKRVIESITDGPADRATDEADGEVEPQGPDKSLRAYARRYFSQEAPGKTLTDRRRLAGDPGGGGRRWMSAGVIYRVLAGLLEVQASASPQGAGYHVVSVAATRHVNEDSWPFPTRDVVEYDIHLLSDGPHLLMLPYPRRHTKLSTVASEHPSGSPQPQLIAVDDDAGSVAAVVFGAHQPPGERIRIEVARQPFRFMEEQFPYAMGFAVNQPVDHLELGVRSSKRLPEEWIVSVTGKVTDDYQVLARVQAATWRCDKPEVGKTYEMGAVSGKSYTRYRY